MITEHASERLISRYASGDESIAGDQLWALEVHLESCAACRGRIAATGSPAVASLLDAVWADVEPALATPPTRTERRWRRWLGTWVAPATLPWVVMMAMATTLGILVDPFSQDSDLSTLIFLAPILPVAGVYASWGRGLDPAYELIAATPRAGLYLVLRRTLTVLVLVIPVLFLAGWLTQKPMAPSLLPALAFTVGTLALGSVTGIGAAAASLAALWTAVVFGPRLIDTDAPTLVLQPGVRPLWVAALAVAAVVVVLRRRSFTRLDFVRR